MEDRPVYPRPPIIEALLEFGVEADRETLVNAMKETLGNLYPGPTEPPTSARDLDEPSDDTTYLKSADGLRLLGCTDGALSVHVLEPYPGWEMLRSQAKDALAALPQNVKEKGLAAITVRYIDRIELPETFVYLDDLFTVMPARPGAMPSHVSAFVLLTETEDDDGTEASLSVASDDDANAVIYDIELTRVSGDDPWPLDAWVDLAEGLHHRQREIFEDSITDATRELFQ